MNKNDKTIKIIGSLRAQALILTDTERYGEDRFDSENLNQCIQLEDLTI